MVRTLLTYTRALDEMDFLRDYVAEGKCMSLCCDSMRVGGLWRIESRLVCLEEPTLREVTGWVEWELEPNKIFFALVVL